MVLVPNQTDVLISNLLGKASVKVIKSVLERCVNRVIICIGHGFCCTSWLSLSIQKKWIKNTKTLNLLTTHYTELLNLNDPRIHFTQCLIFNLVCNVIIEVEIGELWIIQFRRIPDAVAKNQIFLRGPFHIALKNVVGERLRNYSLYLTDQTV